MLRGVGGPDRPEHGETYEVLPFSRRYSASGAHPIGIWRLLRSTRLKVVYYAFRVVRHSPGGRFPARRPLRPEQTPSLPGASPRFSPAFCCGRRFARRGGPYSLTPLRRSCNYAFSVVQSVRPTTPAPRRPRDEGRREPRAGHQLPHAAVVPRLRRPHAGRVTRSGPHRRAPFLAAPAHTRRFVAAREGRPSGMRFLPGELLIAERKAKGNLRIRSSRLIPSR